MTITLFSNFLNPHQLHFCRSMANILGDGFVFVATQPFDQNKVTKGFDDINLNYGFCLPSYLNDDNKLQMLTLCDKSDVAIFGSAPEWIFRRRIKTGKLTFRYSERAFKPLSKNRFNPIAIACMIKGNTVYNNYPLYMLCASAYTATDYLKVKAYKNKAYRWGYFPKGSDKSFEDLSEIKSQNEKPLIIWVGRMINWKHGEKAIEVAKQLKECGVNFSLKLIGDGDSRLEWETLSLRNNLNQEVEFMGNMKNSRVISQLEKADIFLFTSDENEGWGAVLNEAMSCGCAVVACSSAGSVPYLIKDEYNGISYNEDDNMKLFTAVKRLCENKTLRKNISLNAKKVITNEWSAENAAKNLTLLCEHLIDGKTASPIQSGPCSLDN